MILKLTIKVRALLYNDEETSYKVYAVDVDKNDADKVELNSYGNISIAGQMQDLDTGEAYTVEARKNNDSRYKGSYNIVRVEIKTPITISEQKDFLSSILTRLQIENIYKKYNNGEDIIKLIQDDEFEYNDIKHLGEKSYLKIKDKILRNLESGKALAYFNKYGISYNTVIKLVREYGSSESAIDIVTKNPYILTDIDGIGFIKADEIALSMGCEKDSEYRIKSAIIYVLQEESLNGHTWIGKRSIVNKAVSLLDIGRDKVIASLDSDCKDIVNVDDKFSLKYLYDSEKYVANFIKLKLNRNRESFKAEKINEFLEWYCEKNNVILEDEQYSFFHRWNENNISLLIGSGGVGKTWLLNILLEMISHLNKQETVSLLAPTGRASKVMSDHTGRTASTIHRRIGVNDGVIDESVIVIDETSMCDIVLVANLFQYVSNSDSKILFVGDDFQLPSVGAGNFLHDMINSKKIPITMLTKTFRQKDDGIKEVSTGVRNNHKFLDYTDDGKKKFGKDCLFHIIDQDYMKDGYIHYYKKALLKYSAEDIVIATPTRKGELGTVAINKSIQKIVNPPSKMKKEKSFGKDKRLIYRVGDIVMNEKNMYNIEAINDKHEQERVNVYNGDMGKIVDIHEDTNEFVIRFDDVKVAITQGVMLNNVVHAWSVTAHKLQGSQIPVVIAIIDKSAKFQLNANLIYTLLSRAQKSMVVLTQSESFNFGMDKFANMDRRSFLKDLIKEGR